MKTVKLKKCPFCGGTADYHRYIDAAVYIKCRMCKATSDIFDYDVKAWMPMPDAYEPSESEAQKNAR